MLRKFGLRPGDWAIFACVLALAVAAGLPFLFAPAGALTCEIMQDDTLGRRVVLAEGYHDTITIEGETVTNVIEIDGKTVRFAQSDCPDQVCVRTGTLTRAGQLAVCLPNRVVVRLIGAGQEFDAVAS